MLRAAKITGFTVSFLVWYMCQTKMTVSFLSNSNKS